jgi:nickel-dependent lactate racemase
MMNTTTTICNAWAEESLDLTFPKTWKLTNYHLPDNDALRQDDIFSTIESALTTEALRTKQKSGHKVCILVDDITRPTCWEPILSCIINILNNNGVANSNITLLTSLASHAQMNDSELALKVGNKIMEHVNIVQHSQQCEFTWFEHQGKKVGINSLFFNADFKIALGTMIPHPFAGFSGGGKAVMPGIADLESIKRNHKLASFGRGSVFDTDNMIRKQMEGIAKICGLDVLINTICNATRSIAAVVAGPPQETFEKGIAIAKAYCAMPLQSNHNVLILNAYPKDQELLQVSNAFNVFATLPKKIKESIKAVVLIARLSKGLGYHGLFSPDGSLYKIPSPLRILGDRKMLFFSPRLHKETYHKVFSVTYDLTNNWTEVLNWLTNLNLEQYDIGLFHQASMQTANG